jgi:hypothetical protein
MNACHLCRKEEEQRDARHYIGGGMWVCFRHWLLLLLGK